VKAQRERAAAARLESPLLKGQSDTPQASRAFWRRLVPIAAAGFVLRLALVHWVPTQPTSDFWGYYHRALNLVATGKYDAIRGRPDATHPPLYALAIAPSFLAFPGHTLGAAKLVNCGLAALAIVLVGLLARRLGGDGAGILAAWTLALLPRALLMACLLASENLYSPILFALVWLLVESARERKTSGLAMLAGLLIGLAALTRTVAYYMFPIWLLPALAARRKWRRILGELALLLLVQHAVMLPWALRNRAVLGRFLFTNTAGGYGLYLGNNPNATGDWYDGSADLNRFEPNVFAHGALAIDDASRRAAWQWMRENPGEALRLYFVKFGIIFRETYIMASFTVSGERVTPPVPGIDVLPGFHYLKHHLHELNGVLFVTGWALVYAGVGGWIVLFARAARTRSPEDWCAALVLPAATLFVPVVSALIAVNGRYRWPVEDLLVPAAALLAAAVLDARRRTRVPVATAG
jgi:4-amino-4-deoxy-L-arabinose transferase-like glycosyltransferase